MTSIAILPCAPPSSNLDPLSMSTPFHPVSMPQSKRPRLSLNTSCSSELVGRGGSGLRLDTLSASSPTIRNTLRNTLDPSTFSPTTIQNTRHNAHRASDSPFTRDDTTNYKPTTSAPLATPSRFSSLTLDTSFDQDTPSTAGRSSPSSTSSSLSSTSSPPRTPKIPYTLSSGPRPILSNSPIPKYQWNAQRRTTFSPVKRRFPPKRQVQFSDPLCEEVVNVRFQLRNFDILSAESSPISEEKHADKVTAKEINKDNDVDEDLALPKTPVAGRRKRERNWVWTLDPLSDQNGDQDPKIVNTAIRC